MENISFDDVKRNINNGKLSFFNFYNLDYSQIETESVDYYINNPHDHIDLAEQKLNRVVTDIETMPDNYPKEDFDFIDNGYVSCLTFYSDKTKTYYAYFLVHSQLNWKYKEEELVNEFSNLVYSDIMSDDVIDDLKDKKIISDNRKLEILFFYNELDLHIAYWDKIKQIQPFILTGFNSDKFDYPYLYRRLVKLVGYEEADKIVSIFSTIDLINPSTISSLKEKKRNSTKRIYINQEVKIPEYTILDILHLYKPRDEKTGSSGLNYGERQNQYTLDNLSKVELGKPKLHYDGNILDFYLRDPKMFLLYNILDVVNTIDLNDKLHHIDLHNKIRRFMSTPFSTLFGNNAFFNTFIYREYKKKSIDYIRYYIKNETGKVISIDDLKGIPTQIDYKLKKKTEPIDITLKNYQSLYNKYPGAYVKSVDYVLELDSTIISLDASSLYPSMMRLFNISPDTYKARIVNPIIHPILDVIKGLMNNGYTKKDFNFLCENVWDKLVIHGVNEKEVLITDKITSQDGTEKDSKKKFESMNIIYYILTFLIKKLLESNLKFENILEPSNNKEQILLNYYLIHVIEITNILHPLNRNINDFAYNRCFDEEKNKQFNYVYVIENTFDSNKKIVKIPKDKIENYLNNYIIAPTGDLFSKHEDNLGLFFKMIEELGKKRLEYQEKKNNENANAIKRIINSAYGALAINVFGNTKMTTAITISGRLFLKLSQVTTENYLTKKYK